MRRVSSRLAVFAVLATSVLGLSAVGATAKTGPTPTKTKAHLVIVKSGTTTITATSATLPVKAGAALVKKNLDGILIQGGGVKFSTAKRSATLRHITLYKIGKRAHLAATVNGKLVKNLGNISGLKYSVTGKDATVSGELHLTAAVAQIINKLVGKHVVSAGYDFGSFTSTLVLK